MTENLENRLSNMKAISGTSLEDVQKQIDALPENAKPVKLMEPVGHLPGHTYKGFYIRKWVPRAGNHPIFDTGVEL